MIKDYIFAGFLIFVWIALLVFVGRFLGIEDWIVGIIIIISISLFFLLLKKKAKRNNPSSKGILFFEKSVDDGRGQEEKSYYAVDRGSGHKSKLYPNLGQLKEHLGIN